MGTSNKILKQKRLKEMLANPSDACHGKASGYNYGCRCDRCSKAGTGTYGKRRTKILQSQEKAKQEMLQSKISKMQELFMAAEAPLPVINGKKIACPEAEIERSKHV